MLSQSKKGNAFIGGQIEDPDVSFIYEKWIYSLSDVFIVNFVV